MAARTSIYGSARLDEYSWKIQTENIEPLLDISEHVPAPKN
jgi:hypothetical protein